MESESDDSSQNGSKASHVEREEITVKSLEAINDTADSQGDEQETLIERLQLLRAKNPYLSLDERAYTIRKTIKEKFTNAAKSSQEKAEEEKTLVERRLNENDRVLEDLISFGNEIITDVQVASEKRELLRREFEKQQRLNLEGQISEATQIAMANYDNIVSRWSELGELKEPTIMFEKLEGQKKSIHELMLSKDEMIAKCQEEIDRMDERFEEDLYQQQTDICAMVERANAQYELLKTAYSHHMKLLEEAIESERQTIALKEEEKWKDFYETIRENEQNKLTLVHQKKSFYNSEIRRIAKQQDEITSATRKRLEKEADILFHELKCTKNKFLVNSEKMDYNYQVLQKRNEENVIINNQQKRRVGKLNESIVQLRKQIETNQSNSEQMITKLSNEIQKLHDSITDLEKKSEIFHLHNRKKFFAVWDNNFKEVKAVIEKVFDIDRMLHEQLLGMPWQKPHLDLDDFHLVKYEKDALLNPNGAPSTSSSTLQMSKTKSNVDKSASYVMIQRMKKFQRPQRETLIRKAEEERQLRQQRSETRLLRNILRKVADRGDFLVEDRLHEFLAPYSADLKTLVCVDNIFAALHITDEAAVKRLVEFFRPYAWCPNCMPGLPREKLKKLYHTCKLSGYACKNAGDVDNDSFGYQSDRSVNDDDDDEESITTAKAIQSAKTEWSIVGSDKINGVSPMLSAESNQKSIDCENHNLVVESALVLTALSEFSNQESKNFEEESKSKRHRSLRPSKAITSTVTTDKSKSSTGIIEISNETICKYWRKFQNYMPEENIKLWHSLEHGLHHYLDVLKKREQLDNECAALRRQNAELKHLLQKFQV